MVDLKCQREDCKFNKNCNCMANGIDVTNKTQCSTYIKSEIKNKHEKDKIPQALVRHNTNVRCEAPCLFESNENCVANGITVLSEAQNYSLNRCPAGCPACSTFLPK